MRHQRRMNGVASANKGSPADNSRKNGDGAPTFNYGGFFLEGEKNVLNDSLWQACAGASVIVPCTGDLVFYFPQGHLEQVADFTRQDGHMELPACDLPSKILCRVMGVQLKAEANTDEVFAQITLIPESKLDEVSSDDKESRLKHRSTSRCFSKTLTLSDTGAHGGFSIPKKLAEECFPLLDMSQQPPGQELVAKDLHGVIWNFRHTYRGQPKRHLLTGGWSSFLHSKKLEPGDTCIFLCGEKGELGIGIRRALKQHNKTSSSTCVISGHSMQLGILATASYAVATGSMFTVYYRPWTCPSEFIVPLDHYMKSAKMKYSCGLRIQMQFEAEESTRRYAGTIIGIDDIDGKKWPGSEWRCLKVKWDAKLDIDMRPERVSPWNIKPLESSGKSIPNLPPPKRPRLLDPSMSGLCDLTKDDIDLNSANYASHICERDLQGQDYKDAGFQQYDSQFKTKNQLHFELQIPVCHCSASFPDDDISTSSPPKQPLIPTTNEECNNISVTRYLSLSNVNSNDSESQGWRASESRDDNDNKTEYKLFGISLNHSELPSPQVAASSSTSTLHVPPMSQSSVSATIPVSKPSNAISGVASQKKCKKCCSVNSRTCTKVLKRGNALGRSIDLSRITGYDELISELDVMFDFQGSLINGSSGWHVVPMDDDGDMMLFGDFPWQLSVRSLVV
ncbi:auxin response factor 2A-like isoform X2 [Prosopis cineraria]|uniref:auxin response factor 2A-like isoform X2 n=1 Tax=Prosopis cineraria TaxID=364024 RepID=UPI00241048C7|nr:auxin response factor 2A-like isoform X2 [Prosopis cineraria]XP_054778290.1 auxin response factor 2A-like isoform X2 [Prosopis cineraria]